nr:hypothetical protein Itr_chr01CG08960 [Ipomoea trifida]
MPDQGSCSKLIEPCGVGSVTVPVAGLHGSVVVLSGAPDNSGLLNARLALGLCLIRPYMAKPWCVLSLFMDGVL